MSLKITVANHYDFDSVARLRRAAWEHDMKAEPSLSPTDFGRATFDHGMQVGGWLSNPNACAILAMDGPDPLGYLVLANDHTAPYRQEPTIFIDGFFVVPEARPRHVAGLLYRKAYKILETRLPRYVQAVVLTHNKYVARMLKGFGFVERGTLLEKAL